MSGKRKYQERLAQLAARAERELQRAIDETGIPVDREALAPYNSYGVPDFVARGCYIDLPFKCWGCGAEETWTAAQQKWWYEVAKGPVYSTAVRCHDCRRKRRERGRPADAPQPAYKRASRILARVRTLLEPDLLAAGFAPADHHRPTPRRARFLDYVRPGELLTVAWDHDQKRLTAEHVAGDECNLTILAAADFPTPRTAPDVEAKLTPFVQVVRIFLAARHVAPSG